MAHTHDEVLAEVRAEFDANAADVAQCYPDDDSQWWVEDTNHYVYAYVWYDAEGNFNVKDYRP